MPTWNHTLRPLHRPRRRPVGRPLRRIAALLVACLALTATAAWAANKDVTTSLQQLKEGDALERREALSVLADEGDQSAVPDVVAALRDSDLVVRKLAEQTLWSIWGRSGDDEMDDLLQMGARLMVRGGAAQSVTIFTHIIERAPDFAEAWNKRATAYYQIGEYEKSLADIDETLKRNPYHFGALSGAGLCLLELGRYQQALTYFDRALAINPNMQSIVDLKKAVLKRFKPPTI